MVSDPEELQDLLSKRNKNHLGQAEMTPFEHKMGYKLLHVQDRPTNMRDITEDTFPYSFGNKEIDFWVETSKHLQRRRNITGVSKDQQTNGSRRVH